MKTHINDVTAYNLGFRFAVLDAGDRCTGYYTNVEAAKTAARRSRGTKIAHLTGHKSADIVRLERNGYSTEIHRKTRSLRNNPIRDFDLGKGYSPPRTTLDRVKESFAPGLRYVAGKPEYGYKEETTWPAPEVEIPVPKGLSYLPHQTSAISAMLHRKNVLLADEQGLGKTIEIIGYMNAAQPDKTLIVCPTIAIRNWYEELKKWLVNKNTVILFYLNGKFSKFDPHGEEGKKYVPIKNQHDPEWNVIITNYATFSGRKTKEESAEEKIKKGQIPTSKVSTEIPVADDGKKKRKKKGEAEATRRTILPKTRKVLKIFEKADLDLLVLDEVHMLKNAVAYFTMALLGEPEDPTSDETPYEGLAHYSKRNIFASGTPIVGKKPIEMFPALHALDKDSYPHIKVWEDEFGGKRVRKEGKSGTYMDQSEAKETRITGIKLRDTVMIRRKADDVLTLPDLFQDYAPITDTDAVKRARALEMKALKVDSEDEIVDAFNSTGLIDTTVSEDEAEDEMMESASRGEDEDEGTKKTRAFTTADLAEMLNDPDLTREERLALQERIAQVLAAEEAAISGTKLGYNLQDIMIARVAMGIAKAKQFPLIYEEVEKLLVGSPRVSDKVVVFYNFETTGDEVHRQLVKNMGFKESQIIRIDGKSGSPEKRGDLVESFKKDPNKKIFLATIGTCSTAITLTCANVTIFMELEYRPAYILQAIKRTHRFGAKENVFVFYAAAKKSIDGAIIGNLKAKQKIQSEVLESYPNEEEIEKYEAKYKTPKLYNVNYSIAQRVLIRIMLTGILEHYKEAEKKNKQYEFLDRNSVSYWDMEKLKNLMNEFNGEGYGSWKYDGKDPLKTEIFPEGMIEEALPIMWKLKGAVPNSLWNGGPNSVDFPTSITGIQKNLFKPQRSATYDYEENDEMPSENNYLHQLLYLATLPTRRETYKQAQAIGRARRALQGAEISQEEAAELQRIAGEAR